MGVAIVAVPSKDDRVWGLSSEKVPHLTLLFLGDALKNPADSTTYIDGMTSSFHPFYLPVERRGLLGDQDADVLFFDKDSWQSEYAEKIRAYLLANPVIRQAYDSIEQFPQWTPHLTLGFPDSPPKSDAKDPDDPVTLTVEFDRIALWTGDYEGVDFPLNSSIDNELRMATTRGEHFLKHFGVKGMKWGVVRDKVNAVRNSKAVKLASASEDHKRAAQVRGKAKLVGVHTLSNKDLQDIITRMNLEVNFKSLKTVEHEMSLLGKGKKWAGNFVNDVLKDAASSWLKRPGSGFSGRTSSRGRAWVGGQPVINGSLASKAIGS